MWEYVLDNGNYITYYEVFDRDIIVLQQLHTKACGILGLVPIFDDILLISIIFDDWLQFSKLGIKLDWLMR